MSTTERCITFRVRLTSADDIGSAVRREELDQALVELMISSGVTFNLHGVSYHLADAQVVGR